MANVKVGCLFCGRPLDEKTKAQHIIPEGIGGTLSTKEVTCTTCNETFGKGIDKVFAEKYQWILVHFPPELVQGYVPPKLPAQAGDGEDVWILPGYRREDRRFEHKFDKETKILQIRAPNESLLKKEMAKHKGEVQRTWKVWEDAGRVRFAPSAFFVSDHYQSAIKILLETLDLLGLNKGFREAVRSPGLEGAINYVRTVNESGLLTPHNRCILSPSGRVWVGNVFAQSGAPSTPLHHRVMLLGDPKSGMLIGIAGVLDTDYFGVVLSSQWRGVSFQYLYQRSPIAGTRPHWEQFLEPAQLNLTPGDLDELRPPIRSVKETLVDAYNRSLITASEYRELNATTFLAEEFAYDLTKYGDAQLNQDHLGESISWHLENIFSANKDAWNEVWPKLKRELFEKLPRIDLPPAHEETPPTRETIILEEFLPLFRTYYKICREYIGEPFNFGIDQ